MRDSWYENEQALSQMALSLREAAEMRLMRRCLTRSLTKVLAIVALSALLLPACGFAPNAAQAPKADVIVTAAPEYLPLAALNGEERFPQGAQLLLIHAGNAEPLVAGFAATVDANVSFDAKTVLFAGKKTASDPWQIWEVTLANHSLRKLIAGTMDAIRPFYLPAGRLVYAQRTSRGFKLTVAGKDASDLLAPIPAEAGNTSLPISYQPGSAIPSDVLLDGRILFESNYPLGSGVTPELYLVYSDGSGVESYRCDHGTARWGGRQLASGDVIFTHGRSMARFTTAQAIEIPVNAPQAEYAGAIAETGTSSWLVSARSAANAHYALKLWKPGAVALQTFFARSGQDIVDPVLVVPHSRPKRHPSGLHDWSYANMLALDARQSREGDLKVAPASVQLETLNADGKTIIVGRAPVEADGSFFVKTPADKPIRFALLDENNKVLRQEQGWFWIRRGEQRICVGCHTGPERASENRLPIVLQHTTIPFDLSGTNPIHATPGGN